MKWAMEQAEEAKIPIHFGGLEIDEPTLYALQVQKNLNPITLYLNYVRAQFSKFLCNEGKDSHASLTVHGGSAYAESLDKYRVNWWVKWLEKIAPYQKKVLIDDRDISMFYSLYRDIPGKNILAVVNQWHVPGIEAHWRHTTQTELALEQINPIGDCDINSLQET